LALFAESSSQEELMLQLDEGLAREVRPLSASVSRALAHRTSHAWV